MTEHATVLQAALDPERDGVDRVRALHQLRGVGTHDGAGRQVARALVAILNEPLHWVASEALGVIHALAPDLAVGVAHGLFVAVDDEGLVDDGRFLHAADVGPTAVPFDLWSLPACPSLPWSWRRPATAVLDLRTGQGPTEIRVLTADGERLVEIGPGGVGVWRRPGPRLRLTFRHNDCIVQRLVGEGPPDGVVTVAGMPLLPAGITVRRLTAGAVVDFGTGVVHDAGVAFDDDCHHVLRVRALTPASVGRGLAMVNDTMRSIGEAQVFEEHGHVVALDDEEFGVVAADADGVHAHRSTLGLLPPRHRVGPFQLWAAAARNGRRQLRVATPPDPPRMINPADREDDGP